MPTYQRRAGRPGARNVDAAQAAQMPLARIDALTLEMTGRFLHADGETLPW